MIPRRVTHYLKWNITEDLSLRYYITFQDKPDLVGKYVLKTHSTKQYQEISSKHIIQELQRLDPNPIEYIGRQINNRYQKIRYSGTVSLGALTA
jgi:hypothetical protein